MFQRLLGKLNEVNLYRTKTGTWQMCQVVLLVPLEESDCSCIMRRSLELNWRVMQECWGNWTMQWNLWASILEGWGWRLAVIYTRNGEGQKLRQRQLTRRGCRGCKSYWDGIYRMRWQNGWGQRGPLSFRLGDGIISKGDRMLSVILGLSSTPRPSPHYTGLLPVCKIALCGI